MLTRLKEAVIFTPLLGRCSRLQDGFFDPVTKLVMGYRFAPEELSCVVDFMYGKADYFTANIGESEIPLRLARLNMLAFLLGMKDMVRDVQEKFYHFVVVERCEMYIDMRQLWIDIEFFEDLLQPLLEARKDSHTSSEGSSSSNHLPSAVSNHSAPPSHFPPPPEGASASGSNWHGTRTQSGLRGRRRTDRPMDPSDSAPGQATTGKLGSTGPRLRRKFASELPNIRFNRLDPTAGFSSQRNDHEQYDCDSDSYVSRIMTINEDCNSEVNDKAEEAEEASREPPEPGAGASKGARPRRKPDDSSASCLLVRCSIVETGPDAGFNINGKTESSVYISVPKDLNFTLKFEKISPPENNHPVRKSHKEDVTEKGVQSASEPGRPKAGSSSVEQIPFELFAPTEPTKVDDRRPSPPRRRSHRRDASADRIFDSECSDVARCRDPGLPKHRVGWRSRSRSGHPVKPAREESRHGDPPGPSDKSRGKAHQRNDRHE